MGENGAPDVFGSVPANSFSGPVATETAAEPALADGRGFDARASLLAGPAEEDPALIASESTAALSLGRSLREKYVHSP